MFKLWENKKRYLNLAIVGVYNCCNMFTLAKAICSYLVIEFCLQGKAAMTAPGGSQFAGRLGHTGGTKAQ